MSFIIFCAHWPEFLRKILKVNQFNIVLDRDKAFLPVPEVAIDSPFSIGPSFIYPAVLYYIIILYHYISLYYIIIISLY